MSFIERELAKIENAIGATPEGQTRECLMVTQQALRWAQDPDAFMSPSNYLNKFHDTTIAPTNVAGTTTVEPSPQPVQ